MEKHGIKFIKHFVPIKIEQIEESMPGKLRVVSQSTNGQETIEGKYNRVLLDRTKFMHKKNWLGHCRGGDQ